MRFCLTLLTAPSHHAILWFALQVPRPRRVPPFCRQVCRRLLHLHRLQPGAGRPLRAVTTGVPVSPLRKKLKQRGGPAAFAAAARSATPAFPAAPLSLAGSRPQPRRETNARPADPPGPRAGAAPPPSLTGPAHMRAPSPAAFPRSSRPERPGPARPAHGASHPPRVLVADCTGVTVQQTHRALVPRRRSSKPAVPATPRPRAVGVGRCRSADQTRARSRSSPRPPPSSHSAASARPGPARPTAALPIRRDFAPGVGSRCGKRRERAADPPPRIAAAARVRHAGGTRYAAAAGRGRPELSGLMCQPAVAGTDSSAGRRGLMCQPAPSGSCVGTVLCPANEPVTVPAGTRAYAGRRTSPCRPA